MIAPPKTLAAAAVRPNRTLVVMGGIWGAYNDSGDSTTVFSQPQSVSAIRKGMPVPDRPRRFYSLLDRCRDSSRPHSILQTWLPFRNNCRERPGKHHRQA